MLCCCFHVFECEWKADSSCAELPTVNENENEVDQHQDDRDDLAAPVEAGEPVLSDDDDLEGTRHSRLSGISGTTAKTSFTQEEADRLEPAEILEDLPDLAGASEKLIRFLLPRGSETPRSSLKSIDSKRYDKLITAVLLHKPSFGTLPYISPRAILRALFDEPDIEQVSQSPQSIIYRVNLVEMMNVLLVKCPPDDLTASYDSLQILDRAFPTSIAGGECPPQALSLWCAIATQMAIARLEVNAQRPAEFLPLQAIRDSFFDEDGNFKHTETLGVSLMSDAERGLALDMVYNVCNTLSAPFQGEGGDDLESGILELKSQFKWEQLLDNALAYYDVRKAQLDQQIDAAGDVSTIVDAINGELQRRSDLKRSAQMKQEIIATQNKPRKSFMNTATVAMLRQKEAALQQQQRQQAAPVANMVAGPPMSSNDNLPRASSGTLPKGAKKRSLLDRQEGAQLINFTQTQDEFSQQDDGGNSGAQAVLLSSSHGEKRRVQDLEDDEEGAFDPTQDKGFEDKGYVAEAREIAAANKRRRLNAPESSASGPPYSSYSNTGDAIAPPESPEPIHHNPESVPITSIYPPPASAAAATPIYASDQLHEALLAASQLPRKNPGSSFPTISESLETLAEDPSSTQYSRGIIIAKQNRAALPKKVQVRRPWTSDEENALIELITTHCSEGISWSALKSLDTQRGDTAQLSTRSAEDMRFKARNMRVTMML
jgi:hypothetical protein